MFGAKQQIPGTEAKYKATEPPGTWWCACVFLRGTTVTEQPVNVPTAIYLGVFSRAKQRVLQAIFKAIAEGGGKCVAALAMLARDSNQSKSTTRNAGNSLRLENGAAGRITRTRRDLRSLQASARGGRAAIRGYVLGQRRTRRPAHAPLHSANSRRCKPRGGVKTVILQEIKIRLRAIGAAVEREGLRPRTLQGAVSCGSVCAL